MRLRSTLSRASVCASVTGDSWLVSLCSPLPTKLLPRPSSHLKVFNPFSRTTTTYGSKPFRVGQSLVTTGRESPCSQHLWGQEGDRLRDRMSATSGQDSGSSGLSCVWGDARRLYMQGDTRLNTVALSEDTLLHSICQQISVATGLQKVSFHSSSKERQCQRILRLLYDCTYLTC